VIVSLIYFPDFRYFSDFSAFTYIHTHSIVRTHTHIESNIRTYIPVHTHSSNTHTPTSTTLTVTRIPVHIIHSISLHFQSPLIHSHNNRRLRNTSTHYALTPQPKPLISLPTITPPSLFKIYQAKICPSFSFLHRRSLFRLHAILYSEWIQPRGRIVLLLLYQRPSSLQVPQT
jgi:hypothetical protein